MTSKRNSKAKNPRFSLIKKKSRVRKKNTQGVYVSLFLCELTLHKYAIYTKASEGKKEEKVSTDTIRESGSTKIVYMCPK